MKCEQQGLGLLPLRGDQCVENDKQLTAESVMKSTVVNYVPLYPRDRGGATPIYKLIGFVLPWMVRFSHLCPEMHSIANFDNFDEILQQC